MTRRPLGRGLDALIANTGPEADSQPPVETSGAASDGMRMVSTDRIDASPFQPRRYFDPDKLEELALAIKSQGIIEPLVVRPRDSGDGAPRYELIAGERRLRAARAAGLESVPVVIRVLEDHQALEMSLVENLVREDLNAIEEARGFERLAREFSLGHEEIAARIGKSRPYVSNAIRLLDLAPGVLEMIERGELSAGQARPLLGIASRQAQLVAARQVVGRKISARGAEEIASRVRRASGANTPRPGAYADPNLAALSESLQRSLKRRVRLIPGEGGAPGRIEIEYYDDFDLTALAATLIGKARTPAS